MAKDKSFYLKTKRDECASSLFCDSDRGALETVRAHFESHPAMPGEKAVKDRMNELLDNPGLLESWDPDGSEREFIAEAYGKTRIRDTRIENRTDVSVFRMKMKEFGTYTQQDNPAPVCMKKSRCGAAQGQGWREHLCPDHDEQQVPENRFPAGQFPGQ